MLRNCRAAAGQIPESEDEMKTLTLSLRGCVGYLVGAQSLGALSNKSVGLAIYDEVDAYPPPKSGQEKATELGSERGKKQSVFFEVLLSKPLDWDGIINQEYLVGTRSKAHVPCPHCETYQELVFESLESPGCQDESGTWDYEALLKNTFYRCISEDCRKGEHEGKIWEHHKPAMVAKRRWVQTNFGADEHKPLPDVFSCEITDMYSTFPTATWGILRREWAESEGDPSKREKFHRGRLARATEKRKIETRGMDIWDACGPYKRGQCPVEPDVVVMHVDIQGLRGSAGKVETGVKRWVKCGFTLKDDACYVIDYGDALSFADIVPEADTPVVVLNWGETPLWDQVNPIVYKGLVDEGFKQNEARSFALTTMLPTLLPSGAPDFRFYTCWGQGGVHARHLRDLVTPRVDEPPNVTHEGYPFYAYRHDDDNFKAMLYHHRIGGQSRRRAALKEETAPPDDCPPIYFPANIDGDFVSEFCQEQLRWCPKKKRFAWWEHPRNPHDRADSVKGCLVMWYQLRPVLALQKAARRQL